MNVCIDCSRMVHALITNKEMKDIYHTRDMMIRLPPVRDYIRWVRKRRVGVVKHPKLLVNRKVMRELRRMEKDRI